MALATGGIYCLSNQQRSLNSLWMMQSPKGFFEFLALKTKIYGVTIFCTTLHIQICGVWVFTTCNMQIGEKYIIFLKLMLSNAIHTLSEMTIASYFTIQILSALSTDWKSQWEYCMYNTLEFSIWNDYTNNTNINIENRYYLLNCLHNADK